MERAVLPTFDELIRVAPIATLTLMVAGVGYFACYFIFIKWIKSIKDEKDND